MVISLMEILCGVRLDSQSISISIEDEDMAEDELTELKVNQKVKMEFDSM